MGRELFDNIPSKVGDLLCDIRNGKVGLPDLQRPFVWKNSRVRDLLDSMLKGYPIGYVMIWQTPEGYETFNPIGTDDKPYMRPDYLVIDGQQRLTALLSSIYEIPVKDKNYKERTIFISFNPLTREFAVRTEAHKKNPEWISEISQAFAADAEHNVSRFRRQFIKNCNASREKNNKPLLTDEEEEQIETNLNDLLNLSIYMLPTLRINSKATEEDVAEIFVRVNSGGQKLTENNFIETLLAVYDNQVHDRINQFCAQSRSHERGTSYNPILEVDPSHLIRMTVGLGFRRARLRYAYMLLRGKNLEDRTISQEEMKINLDTFRNALDKVTNLTNWHAFMGLFDDIGYVNKSLIASTNTVVYCYVLYLIGKYDYHVPPMELQRIIRKWIFMSTITQFYIGSTESEVEKQFADLRGKKTPEEFINYLENIIRTRFSDDYFQITLPATLTSSSAQSPAWYGYVASLNILGTPVLFSTTILAVKMRTEAGGPKAALDKHHIFPKNYLKNHGYTSDRDINQIANYTYLDYNTNIDISDDPPEEYVKRFRERLGEEEYKKTCMENALPEDFEHMSYPEFLEKRRHLMADIIRKAYDRLCK